MPTGNEYSDVRYNMVEQSYKQTEREQRDGQIDPRIGGPLAEPAPNNYPNTFDRQMGSEVTGPDNYPEGVYNHIPATGDAQWYTKNEQQSVSGEYGQSDGITAPYYPGTNMVPSPTPSKQFSSDCTGDPKQLLEQTRAGVDLHSSLNEAYGLCQPVATLGSHPWLRDGLTTTGETEAGNAVPEKSIKTPFRGE